LWVRFLARLFATLRVKFLNYLEGNLSGLGVFEPRIAAKKIPKTGSAKNLKEIK